MSVAGSADLAEEIRVATAGRLAFESSRPGRSARAKRWDRRLAWVVAGLALVSIGSGLVALTRHGAIEFTLIGTAAGAIAATVGIVVQIRSGGLVPPRAPRSVARAVRRQVAGRDPYDRELEQLAVFSARSGVRAAVTSGLLAFLLAGNALNMIEIGRADGAHGYLVVVLETYVLALVPVLLVLASVGWIRARRYLRRHGALIPDMRP